MFNFSFELDMARQFHLVSVIFMILVISQVLVTRSHQKRWETVREKVGERQEENERREEKRENPKGSLGWRRKRSLHGTLTCVDILFF